MRILICTFIVAALTACAPKGQATSTGGEDTTLDSASSVTEATHCDDNSAGCTADGSTTTEYDNSGSCGLLGSSGPCPGEDESDTYTTTTTTQSSDDTFNGSSCGLVQTGGDCTLDTSDSDPETSSSSGETDTDTGSGTDTDTGSGTDTGTGCNSGTDSCG